MSQFHFQCVSHSLISVCLTLSHIHEGSHSLTLNTLRYERDLQSLHRLLPRISRGLAFLKQTQFILRISWISCVSDTIHYVSGFLAYLRQTQSSFSGFLERDCVVEIFFPHSPHWCLAHLLQTQFLVRVLSTRDFLHPIVPFFLPLLQRLPFCAT